MLTAAVQSFIEQLLNHTCTFTSVGGGSINHTYRIRAGSSTFFCKVNSLSAFPALFDTEQQGLTLLAQQQVIRIPRVIATGHAGDSQVLLLEWIEQGLKTDAFWKTFGEQLAALHRIQGSAFGLATDNYMGALPQNNKLANNWIEFFIQQRLQPQVQLAVNRQLLEPAQAQLFEKLYQGLHNIFPAEPASLLHGDLWSGNFLCDDRGKPVLIDPAVYYGHRSMDMAMTTLFGGFDALFYESYQYHFPLPANYRQQWEVCNLYPLLIHLNLFGKSYLADILNTIRRY
ncbi:fructosamine kinase family protein [Niastella caeni]|uniref:Fructosamine kinase family protein n=1 Tax=Niastella caeni TaxID=2569763 RepID=A0A4S8HD48_9BACT|nr:fructosamine kinase family protein [Niastella caeni]THU32958.1 fructosamine kinase family protein [Niastella caeni]